MKTLIFAGLLFLFTACGNYSHVKTPSPISDNSNQTLVDKSKIDFALIKSEILTPHCISCHKGTHKIYDTYLNVRNSSQIILNRMKSPDPSVRMPPQREGLPSLSPQLIALFEAWVSNGSPEFINEIQPDKPIDKIEQMSFKEIKEKIFKPYNCISCHSQYNDYVVVQSNLGSIVSLVANDEMPFPRRKNQKAEPVSVEHKNLLVQWVKQGAPEFSDQASSPIPTVKLEPTWVSLRNNVFGPKCILCHNSFGPRGPKSLATYPEVRDWFMKNPELFNFENPDSSYFIGAILGTTPESFGLKMPYNNELDDLKKSIPDLTTLELDTIKEWIKLKLPHSEEDL